MPDDDIGLLAQEPPVSQRKVLRLGFTDYPPFAYQEDGEFRGFDIEYIQAIAKEMGSTVEMVEFETIPQCLQGLQDGLIDMAAGGLSMTAERGKCSLIFPMPIMNQAW